MQPTLSGYTTTVPAKPFWKSKTLWLNLAAFLAFAIGQVIDAKDLIHLPAAWQAYLGVAVAILNGLSRFMTTQPVDASTQATPVLLTQVTEDGVVKADRTEPYA